MQAKILYNGVGFNGFAEMTTNLIEVRMDKTTEWRLNLQKEFREEADFINDKYGLGDEDHISAIGLGHIYELMREFATIKANPVENRVSFAEPNQQNGGWIKVKEQLPEHNVLVLATQHEYLDNSKPRYINIIRFIKDDGCWYDADEDDVFEPDYWMPLPKPPLT